MSIYRSQKMELLFERCFFLPPSNDNSRFRLISTNGRVNGVTAKVTGVTTTLASSGTYLPFGPMTGLTYGNSKVLTAAFNTDYNPTSRAVAGLYSSTYATDANSNITQAGTTTYGYDALNRVNAENPGTASSYTYDLTDNRLTKVQGTTTTTTVPSTSNKISAVGASSYTYDLAGNITGDGTNTYTWNAAGQLETVKVGATTVGTYTYDSLGRRAKKVAGATTTYYAYGPNGLLYGEYTSTGTLVKEYVYLNNAPLAQIATGSPEVLTYLHTDHLGTPRYATNTAGASVWTWVNDAFGVSTPTGTVTVNLRMPGQYFDSESGNFYNWNRYYNPRIGRYISPDPIGQEGGLNLFNYVGQNPVMGIDPMGLQSNGSSQYMTAEDMMAEYGPLSLIGGVARLPGQAVIGIINWIRGIDSIGGSNKSQQVGAQCPRPDGIPSDWIEVPSAKGGGMEYINPKNPNDRVRVMPGNPNSLFPAQRGRYVVDQNGSFRDVNGNPIKGIQPGKSTEAHIPYDQFIFRR